MKNIQITSNRISNGIQTKHVFIEDEQVFLKKDVQETLVADTNTAEWFPTDFKWIPVSV